MAIFDEKFAISLLKKYSSSDRAFKGVLSHSVAVKKLAVNLARKAEKNLGKKLDLRFIAVASLLHDIGRFKVPPGRGSGAHGYVGGLILKKEGFPRSYSRVCETHVGTGIKKSDVASLKMDIPKKDYLPKSMEEKIICYADKLISYDKLIPVEKEIERFNKELGLEYGRRLARLHNYIMKITGESEKIKSSQRR